MSGHELTTVSALATTITKGTTPTTGGGSFSSAGVAFVKVESIRADGSIDRSKIAYIDENTHQRLKRSILAEDDILYTIAGTIGRVAKVPAALLPANTNQAVAIVRPDCTKVDPRFLMYALRDGPRVQQAQGRAVQSVQANLSLSELGSLEVWAPTLPAQRAISEVLGAIDDKIAANSAILASAVQLSDYLFIAARNGTSIRIATFDEVATVGGGGTPSTKVPEFWNGDIPWVTPTDVTALGSPYLERTARMITDAGLAKCSSGLHPVGSILLTSRATIGAFALAKVPVAVNQGFIVAQAKDRMAQMWLFHEMRSRVDDFLAHANGATFLELSKGTFKALPVPWPTDAGSFGRFAAQVDPLHERAFAASVESRRLAELRDTLLPHLMSGRITVREAEKRVEEAV